MPKLGVRADQIRGVFDRCEAILGPALQEMPIVIWITDATQRRVLYVSPGYEAIWGASREDLYKAPLAWVDLIHPDDRPAVMDAFHSLQNGAPYDVTYRITSTRGATRWIKDRGYAMRDAAGSTYQCVGLAQDITDAHHSGTALREKSHELGIVTEAYSHYLATGGWKESADLLLAGSLEVTGSPVGFLGVMLPGPKLRVLSWHGLVWDDFVGRDFYEKVIRQSQQDGYLDFPSLDNLLGVVAVRGEVLLTDDPSSHPDSRGFPAGHPLISRFLGVPMRSDTRVIGMMAVANRPTEYADHERQRLEMFANLSGVFCQAYLNQMERTSLEEQLRQSQKMEAVGRLAGGIAHDFNNLLQIMNGYADLLVTEPAISSQMRDGLERIQRAGIRASGLTRQLLAFSRKQVLMLALLDLGSLVIDAEKLFRRLIGEDIQVEVVRPDRLPPVMADLGQMEQVLLNLLVNARDAMPDGGKIKVELRSVAAAEEPALPGDGLHVLLEVSDTGAGIPRDVLPHIFEPFFTTKDKDKGTGLGLSTVHGIVHQSGGVIRVKSELHRGTTFRVFLPAAAGVSAPDSSPKTAGPTDSATGQTVLLLEDEEDIRIVLSRMLGAAGFRVLVARDGEQAIRFCREHPEPIHVLLTDVVMPDVSGPVVADEARRLRPGLGVVFMSGYTDHPAFRHGVQDPTVSFIHKPFDAAVLTAAIQAALLTGSPAGAPLPPAGRPLRALVVDDALMNVEMLQSMLENLGWESDGATGGEQALQMLEVTDYAVVFLDCLMPDIDGFETTTRIRWRSGPATPATPATVPIVGVTASGLAGDRERCLQVGMDDVMPKPVTTEALLASLHRWVDGPVRAAAQGDEEVRRIKELIREIGRPATSRLIDLFHHDLTRQVSSMRSSVAAREASAMYQAAHFVKGAASNMGATRLADACRELETRARAGRIEGLDPLLRRVSDEADRVIGLLRSMR